MGSVLWVGRCSFWWYINSQQQIHHRCRPVAIHPSIHPSSSFVKTDMSLFHVIVSPLLFRLRYFLTLSPGDGDLSSARSSSSFTHLPPPPLHCCWTEWIRGNNEGILLLNPFYCWYRNLLSVGTLSEIHMPKRIGWAGSFLVVACVGMQIDGWNSTPN